MKLIVGLGNIGTKYSLNRHNVGFILIDSIVSSLGLSWSESSKLSGYTSKGSFEGEDCIFLKPTTQMNLSGKSISSVASYYKISPQDIYVVHDDMDIPLGEIKRSYDSRSAGHNGVEDIIEQLGTKEFYRIRVGISRPEFSGDVLNYVLGDFSEESLKLVRQSFSDILKIGFFQK